MTSDHAGYLIDMPERYWFNVATRRVETDDDAGRRGDRLGPYPSREAAEHALVTARARTDAWEAGRETPAWRPPGPARLTRFDSWLLRHRIGARVVLVAFALLLLALGVWGVVDGDGSWLPFYLLVTCVTTWINLRGLDRRAEQLERR